MSAPRKFDEETRARAVRLYTDWQRDLTISHNKLGDIASARADLAGADTDHQAALTIR